MPSNKSRYVTACQQLLALGAVLAVLTPAAAVVSLDVVHRDPDPAGPAGAAGAAYARVSAEASLVPAEPVEATVEEFSLTAPSVAVHGRAAVPQLEAEQERTPQGTAVLTSTPQDVEGYGAVGVTWSADAALGESDLEFSARTRTGETWSDWTPLEYHDEHGPDAGSLEASRVRPGTDELLVGEVDQVQVQAVAATGELPADMRLAVVDPGEATQTRTERAAIEADAADAAEQGLDETTEGLELQASTTAPRPTIYSRAQWGANENLRDKGSLSYGKVTAGFVHHTVNANSYTKEQVPGIIRSIYAYHTQSRGWSDVGYNFLVDRFGRIWEGRAGGVAKAVVGAHTLGYNESSFAMSAIGNFETAQPSAAVVQAYGALFAWKLGIHGVDAGSMRQQVAGRTFPAINGHRDAGSTACPGRYLYAKLGAIRTAAVAAQKKAPTPPTPTPTPTPPTTPPAPPTPTLTPATVDADLAGTSADDLVVRRAADGRLLVLPTGGLTRFLAPRVVTRNFARYDTVLASPDLTGDGRPDLLVRARDGRAGVRPGLASGHFVKVVRWSPLFRDLDLITAVGDLDADGRNDLVGRVPGKRKLTIVRGNGRGGFGARVVKGWYWDTYDRLVGAGDVTGDGRPDLLARDTDGKLWLHRGTAAGGFAARVAVGGDWSAYDTITGYGDYNRDGHRDLFVRTSGKGRGFVHPGRGDGTFGPRLGMVDEVRGVRGLTSGGHVLGSAEPDLVGRVGDDLVVVQHAGTVELERPVDTGYSARAIDTLLIVGDWDKDGHVDVITRTGGTGKLFLRRGDGTGKLAKPKRISNAFAAVSELRAVGDVDRDGFPDLLGRAADGSLRVYLGKGLAGFGRTLPAPASLTRRTGSTLAGYDWVLTERQVDGVGARDTVARFHRNGRLYLLAAGTGKPRLLGERMGVYDLAG